VLAMGVLLLATAAPAFAVQPECFPDFGFNCGSSLEHRSNASGQGNFGQCHQTGAIEGQQSSEFNPSSQNTGEADCRTVSGRVPSEGSFAEEASDVIACPEGEEPVAETQINFQPPPISVFQRDACV
jgi:hypothetical protein